MQSGRSWGYGKENSGNTLGKEGVAIYGDWNGKVSSDYKMKAEESNILIIDKSGRVKFFTSGEVKAEGIHDVKELLKTLAGE
jgi:predicted transcriptional regulator